MKEDTKMLMPDREGQVSLSSDGSEVGSSHQSWTLYITLGPDGAFKAGTCQRCVVEEQERPERSWEADGDSVLDFDRDTLFAHLADLGVVLTNRQAYLCP
jgi:hypothetical protein